MLSAVISSAHSYPAMPLACPPVHQGCVHSGPLVLGVAPLKLPAPTVDRDQTVSRRFKPSSRTTLNGEQPYPWDRLQPQDVPRALPAEQLAAQFLGNDRSSGADIRLKLSRPFTLGRDASDLRARLPHNSLIAQERLSSERFVLREA